MGNRHGALSTDGPLEEPLNMAHGLIDDDFFGGLGWVPTQIDPPKRRLETSSSETYYRSHL